jgi:acetyl-CoA carboxylase carboxyl transferase subunit beta
VPESTWTQTDLAEAPAKKGVPEGLWMKCPSCEETLFKKAVESNLWVCPKCQHHMRVSARQRVEQLLDPGTFESFDDGLIAIDPLKFVDSRPYPARIADTQRKTGERDALLSGFGFVKGRRVVVAVMDFTFLGGSMGSVVGEKITRAIERGIDHDLPVVTVSCSGGARMHESGFSLMQMAKTSAALGRLAQAGLPFISVLTHPTMGGVTASFATLGDLNIAEPGALIGFAGARVIKETTKQTLPAGFQSAEFLLKHGLIDQIVSRLEMRSHLAGVLSALYLKRKPQRAAS